MFNAVWEVITVGWMILASYYDYNGDMPNAYFAVMFAVLCVLISIKNRLYEQ